MPNRVADLESSVAQLQATVNGLRDELVDANERIRTLERELETREEATAVPERKPRTPTSKDNGESDDVPASIDDIIVA